MVDVKVMDGNRNLVEVEKKGCFTVYEHQRDLSVTPGCSEVAYFMQEMNFKKRQVLCELNNSQVKVQAGAMQWTAGNIECETGVKGVGGFLKGAMKGLVTGESAIKPLYTGSGYLMLEPSYNYLLVEDVASWGPRGIVIEDGMFLACESSVQEKIVARSSASSAFAGGEGFFNLCLCGKGHAVLESYVPREELIEIDLQNDVCKIDGNMAIAWSGSLQFTVERSSKSLIGSAVNGEGLVNVYRGTGKILMSPTLPGTLMNTSYSPSTAAASKGIGSRISDMLSDS